MSNSAHVSIFYDPAPPANIALYQADSAPLCDGAQTLRLVERAVESMRDVQARADVISGRALDLIMLTRRERAESQAEMTRAREDAASWRQHSIEAEHALREALLRTREADVRCREMEQMLREARERAEASEARAIGLEFYLKKISSFLQVKLSPIVK